MGAIGLYTVDSGLKQGLLGLVALSVIAVGTDYNFQQINGSRNCNLTEDYSSKHYSSTPTTPPSTIPSPLFKKPSKLSKKPVNKPNHLIKASKKQTSQLERKNKPS